jgi:hypothetical protein
VTSATPATHLTKFTRSIGREAARCSANSSRQSTGIERWLSFLTVPGTVHKTHNSPLAAQFTFPSNQLDWKSPGRVPGGAVKSGGLRKRMSVRAGLNRSAQKQTVLSPVQR